MSLGFLAFFAFIPIAVSIFMRHAMNQSRVLIMPVSCLLAAIISMMVWKTPAAQISTSFFAGLVISLQLILLMVSVIFCMETLRATGVIDSLRPIFEKASPDRRVQAILVAWFFEAGMESLFGFASTGGICTIILYGIGFPPSCAVMLSVLGLMTSSTFGIAGAPILFGAVQGLGQPDFAAQLANAGWSLPNYLRFISAQVGIIGGIAGTFVPLLMVIFMQRFFGRRRTWTAGLSFAPFAIFCGLAFTIPYAFVAVYMGPQFPSLVGAFIGLALALTAARTGFLLPKETWDFPPHCDWSEVLSGESYKEPAPVPKISPWLVIAPFVALGCFVVVANLPDLKIMELFENYMSRQRNPLSFLINPFFLFFSVFFALIGLVQLFTHNFDVAGEVLGQRMRIPVFHALRSLPFIMPMVRIYIDSGANSLDQPGMFRAMAEWLMKLPFAEYWTPFFSPFLGAAATHYAVSNIYSNLTLSSLQHQAGSLLHSGSLFVALQVVGASAGCMFAMHYLIGTSVSINRTEVVGPVGRKTLVAMLVYLTIVGILGTLSVHYFHLPEQLMYLYVK